MPLTRRHFILFFCKKYSSKLYSKTVKTIIFPHLIEKIAFSNVEFNVLSMTKKADELG